MADVADLILSKKPDAVAAAPVKTDFSNIFEPPKLTPKPASDTMATATTATTATTADAVAVKETAPAKLEIAPVEQVTPPKDAPATDKSAAALELTIRSPELVKGLTLSKEVARILDNDVPQANHAHNIPAAEAAYNKAIDIAKQVTPDQIAVAKADYEAVLKAKVTEKNPEKLRALADRQAADYTLMRVNDCAQGNKALWLYRQGRIEEGSAQFLQAAGLSPDDAKNLSKLTPEQKATLGEKLNANATILTDPNFMRQYMRIIESGQKLPQEFVDIHQYLRDQQENVAAAASTKTTDTGAKLPELSNTTETTDAGSAITPIAPDDKAALLASSTLDQLIEAAHVWGEKGADFIPQTKAAYEELLKRLEDPARIEAVKKQLESNVVALENDGRPMDVATRLPYHAENVMLLKSLTEGISFRQEYAAYLGSKVALAIDTKKPENLQPVLGADPNQMNLNKSMNDQLKLVYQAADNMPVDLMMREKVNLEKSMSTIGSSDTEGVIPKALDFLQGKKDTAGIIDIAVTTRTASAMMYISQGAVFNKEKNAWEQRSLPQIDSLYQPTMAFELLKQADAKYKKIHGADATDPSLDAVKAFGAQLAPEQFKAVITAANTKMWSTGVDIVDTSLSFATQLLVAALLSKTKMGFAARHAIADATSFGVNYATRSVAMRLGTGQWEAPTETAWHAAATTGMVSVTKYGSKTVNYFLNRNLTGYESVAMAARSMDNTAGKVMTFGEYGERLAAKGMKTEADAIRNSGSAGRKIADMTNDELRAVLPTSRSPRGAEAMNLIEGSMTPELKAINALQRNGISTVGDIKAAVATDLSKTQEFIQAAKAIPGYQKLTPVQAMEKLGTAGNIRFDTPAKIVDELAALGNGARLPRLGSVESIPLLREPGRKLATREMKSISDIETYVAKATTESEMARLFPGLKGQADDVLLRQVEAQGSGIFGNLSRTRTDGQGWRSLDHMADGIEKIQAKTLLLKAKDVAFTNRFYAGLSVPKVAQSGLVDVKALTAAMTRRADAAAVGSYVAGYHVYESITGVYDRLGKGVDEEKPKKYNFSEAMLEANFGSTNPTGMDFLSTVGRDLQQGFFAGQAFRGFSKLGMAETRDLAAVAVFRQSLSSKTLGYQAFNSPAAVPFIAAATTRWTKRDMVSGADQPLLDRDYGLGTAISPTFEAQKSGFEPLQPAGLMSTDSVASPTGL